MAIHLECHRPPNSFRRAIECTCSFSFTFRRKTFRLKIIFYSFKENYVLLGLLKAASKSISFAL